MWWPRFPTVKDAHTGSPLGSCIHEKLKFDPYLHLPVSSRLFDDGWDVEDFWNFPKTTYDTRLQTLSRVIMCQVSSWDLRSSLCTGERRGLRATSLQSVTISSHRLEAAFWAELELLPLVLDNVTLLCADDIFVVNHHTKSCNQIGIVFSVSVIESFYDIWTTFIAAHEKCCWSHFFTTVLYLQCMSMEQQNGLGWFWYWESYVYSQTF